MSLAHSLTLFPGCSLAHSLSATSSLSFHMHPVFCMTRTTGWITHEAKNRTTYRAERVTSDVCASACHKAKPIRFSRDFLSPSPFSWSSLLVPLLPSNTTGKTRTESAAAQLACIVSCLCINSAIHSLLSLSLSLQPPSAVGE